MLTAAVLWSVVSAWSAANALDRMSTGDTLQGLGELFVGLAALVAAVMSGRAQRASRKAESHSAVAAKVLGPPNGRTVQEQLSDNEAVLTRIDAEHAYQQDRNHKIMNGVGAIRGSMPVLLLAVERNTEATERLLDRLNNKEK